ncbi:MAG: medium chain dehydrogenase/reductase family protein [Ignavibacteriaceae bacterium]|jgi:alcohol dehydrogenase|nr:medium chain dehydrogenase/reductase family protein [Ignavibacteriaceae bacterium]MCW8812054.1 medium chain dehydrogenase/reductase family protein [Chlorobium sp.]MCW8817175.1 medium chain dehydrogenase/reductase family protein [Ignavibacteriaceae bacterium]MCW8822888.1 medium chain dehydrogenase/reductase family protein [Ignavibacteriaceae bacterium]
MRRKSFRISKAGSLNNIKLVEEKLPEPEENEVTIEVKAIGLNFADLFAIQGLYSATPKGSYIPGLEYSGIIVKKGKDVKDFEIGSKVMGAIRFGAYTTHLNIDHHYVIQLPDDWSFEEGAAFIVQSLTAYYSLVELGNIKQEYTVLIHSAAGGVGIYANRIAKTFNAFTIGTIGSESKRNFLINEGYDEIIFRSSNFSKKLQHILEDRKLNIVLESIGGKIFEESFNALAPSGRIIIYGGAQFMSHSPRPEFLKLIPKYLFRPKIDPLSLSNVNKSIMGFNLIYLWDRPDDLRVMAEQILKMELKRPYIGKVFSFKNLIEALKYFQTGRSIGKVVVKT